MLELVEELCPSGDERRQGIGVAKSVLVEDQGATVYLKLHQADWLLAPDLAKEEGKQDAAVHLC